jgi:hypothetical protein
LGYLLIAAKQYTEASKAFDNYGKEFVQDTIQAKSVEFTARMYCEAIASNQDFETIYPSIFYNTYNKLDGESTTTADYFINIDDGASQKIKANIDTLKTTDSISKMAAVSLCKYYGISLVYAPKTIEIEKKILAKIEDDKYIKSDSILVQTPDGATIALTIIRDKKITTPQPVVLMYNIYAGYDEYACKDAVNNGYVGIVADTRGKRLSPDAIEPFEHDAEDAYYIIDWISNQPWCNGKIGMYGGSYLGFSQWASVKYLHPALKTIVPQVSVGAGIDYPMQNI